LWTTQLVIEKWALPVHRLKAQRKGRLAILHREWLTQTADAVKTPAPGFNERYGDFEMRFDERDLGPHPFCYPTLSGLVVLALFVLLTVTPVHSQHAQKSLCSDICK
jgi:hypothetical protein